MSDESTIYEVIDWIIAEAGKDGELARALPWSYGELRSLLRGHAVDPVATDERERRWPTGTANYVWDGECDHYEIVGNDNRRFHGPLWDDLEVTIDRAELDGSACWRWQVAHEFDGTVYAMGHEPIDALEIAKHRAARALISATKVLPAQYVMIEP